MKLRLPLNKALGDPTKLRLFVVDYLRIKEIAEATMHSDSAVTRLALHLGLPLIAKQLGVKLPEPNGNGNGNRQAADDASRQNAQDATTIAD